MLLFIISVNRIDWDEWEEWGPCSVSCETGWTTRKRKCIDTVTSEAVSPSKCFGRDVEYQSCTLQQCPSKLSAIHSSRLPSRRDTSIDLYRVLPFITSWICSLFIFVSSEICKFYEHSIDSNYTPHVFCSVCFIPTIGVFFRSFL